jgi:transposase-like protein
MSKQNNKSRRAKYALELELEAVRLVKGGQDALATAQVLGIPKATLCNWIRALERGELHGAMDRPVSAEQMKLARLRPELARVKMERDILKRSDGVLRKGITVKYAWIDKLTTVWPVTLMCQVLGVSSNGIVEHRPRNSKTPPAGLASSRVGNATRRWWLTSVRSVRVQGRIGLAEGVEGTAGQGCASWQRPGPAADEAARHRCAVHDEVLRGDRQHARPAGDREPTGQGLRPLVGYKWQAAQ